MEANNELTLRPPTLSDCEQVRLWRNQCLETLRTPYPLTAEMQSEFYKNVICNRNSPHRYWSVYEGDKLIGFTGLTNLQWENRIAEISLIVDPDIKKKGYGTKIVEMILRVGFNQMNLKTVMGECYFCNSAVDFWRKITEKYNGYTTILPNTKFWDGKFYDSLYFSLNRTLFNERDRD